MRVIHFVATKGEVKVELAFKDDETLEQNLKDSISCLEQLAVEINMNLPRKNEKK